MDVYGVQNAKERETPGNAINNNLFATGKELIDNGAKKQQMYQRPAASETWYVKWALQRDPPNKECPWGGGDVRLLCGEVNISRGSNSIEVGA